MVNNSSHCKVLMEMLSKYIFVRIEHIFFAPIDARLSGNMSQILSMQF